MILRGFLFSIFGLNLKNTKMKFIEITEANGEALTINPDQVVRFTPHPNGGSVIFFSDGKSMNINDEYHTLRNRLNS